MSIFICPNTSRSLLRLAVRGLPPKTQRASTSRWLSCSAPQSRPISPSRHSPNPLSRAQSAVTVPSPSYRYGDRRTLFSSKTIRNYEDLPRDYRDQTGLAFRARDLTEVEAMHVFGPDLGAVAANHLLRILHGRRVAGTLDDPAFAVHTAQFTEEQKERALQHLRKTVPVEEVLNAGLRAEDELIQMEEAEAKKKKTAAAEKPEEDAEAEYKEDPIYGRSNFDRVRAQNIAKRKAEKKALEEERKAAEARGETAKAGPLAKAQERQITNPRIAEYYEKAQSDLTEPPEMKAWERILPSATAVVLVLGFLTAVAMAYEEPSSRYRLFREITTSQATVGALIAANVLVFAAWKVPPLWKFMNKYMLVVVATVKPVTMFTAVFSHQTPLHLAINMLPLWFVGTALHDELGRADFLTLYAACGALGFVGSLATYTLRGMLGIATLGASGAVLGITSAWFWEHRGDGFRFFGLPGDGVHGVVLLALVAAMQLGAWGRTAKLKADVASHIVGMLSGIAGVEVINRLRGRHEGERRKAVFDVVDPVVKPVMVKKNVSEAQADARSGTK